MSEIPSTVPSTSKPIRAFPLKPFPSQSDIRRNTTLKSLTSFLSFLTSPLNVPFPTFNMTVPLFSLFHKFSSVKSVYRINIPILSYEKKSIGIWKFTWTFKTLMSFPTFLKIPSSKISNTLPSILPVRTRKFRRTTRTIPITTFTFLFTWKNSTT